MNIKLATIRLEYKGKKKILYFWKERTSDKNKGVIYLPEWWDSFQMDNLKT